MCSLHHAKQKVPWNIKVNDFKAFHEASHQNLILIITLRLISSWLLKAVIPFTFFFCVLPNSHASHTAPLSSVQWEGVCHFGIQPPGIKKNFEDQTLKGQYEENIYQEYFFLNLFLFYYHFYNLLHLWVKYEHIWNYLMLYCFG